MSPILLLVIFSVELVVQIINAIGATNINNLLWAALNRLPIPSSKLAADNRKLQKEFLRVRRDLNVTSSQDEFAKWAKVRRHHDKLLEQLESNKKEMTALRGNFDTYINVGRLVLTRAPQWVIPFWYSAEPMFWLPHGLFPHYAEWFLSLPKAPLGSVSIMSWQVASSALLSLTLEVLTSLWILMFRAKTASAPAGAAGSARIRETKIASSEKKEL